MAAPYRYACYCYLILPIAGIEPTGANLSNIGISGEGGTPEPL